MAKQSLKHELYEAGVSFAQTSVNKILKDKKKKIDSEEKQLFGNPKLIYRKAKLLLRHAKEMNDDKLIKLGQYGRRHRTTQYPFNESNRNLIKLQPNMDPILDRQTLHLYRNPDETTFEQYQIYNRANQEQGDILCNGGQLRVGSDLLE